MLDQKNREQWRKVEQFVAEKFLDGEIPDVDAVLFLIGVRELGIPHRNFKKDEKIDILHIAICRVLMPYGYYELTGLDEDGWPHYRLKEKLPALKAGEQSVLIKEAIIRYFEEEGVLS